jgi:hypothetical protein
MYTSLVDAFLFADCFINILIAMGIFLSACALGCSIWWGYITYDGRNPLKKRAVILPIFLWLLTFVTIAVGNSNYFQPEYITLKIAAPQIDKYIENHPEVIYNPDAALTLVNDTAISLVASIKGLPNIVKRLSAGESVESIRIQQDMAEFRAWKASQQK